VNAEELTFGQNRAMKAEMGRNFLVAILFWGKGAWENMWTCRVLWRICGPVGCLGEYVDLYCAWENMWTCRMLGRICGSVGCLGEYVDL
jgi:hypothetical protein